MERVRQRLGYERLDLWGASWGTRTALLYMREFPQRVRSAVLDGVTGPNAPLFAGEAKYAQAALDALLRDCAADRDCASAFPDLRTRALARCSRLRRSRPNGSARRAAPPRSRWSRICFARSSGVRSIRPTPRPASPSRWTGWQAATQRR
jgi:pimeloyl-ACP methyl ester carboxylesterase